MNASRHGLARWIITGTAAVVAASGLLLAPSASGATPMKKVQANDIRYCDFAQKFCKPTDHNITVAVGTRVTWYYMDKICDRLAPCPGHNVVMGGISGPVRKKDGAILFSMMFRTKGTYNYHCVIHQGLGMTGTITVV
jgi:plastocyanin